MVMAFTRYVVSYTSKSQGGGYKDSDVAKIIHCHARKLAQHDEQGRPRTLEAAEAASPKEITNTAISVAMTVATQIINTVQISAPMAALYMVAGKRSMCSHVTVRAPIHHAALALMRLWPANENAVLDDRLLEVPTTHVRNTDLRTTETTCTWAEPRSRPRSSSPSCPFSTSCPCTTWSALGVEALTAPPPRADSRRA